MKGSMPPAWSMEIDYLLDRMDESARAGFQARILEDHEAFARVAEVENELFDAYVRGTLPPDLRHGFEQTLLKQPGATRKLTLARRLARSPEKSAFPRRKWLAVAAGVVALVGGAFYSGREAGPRPLVLRLPAIERGAEAIPVYDLNPRPDDEIDLVVDVPAGPQAERFGAVLTASKGEAVAQWPDVAPAEGSLHFRLRGSKIPEGAYLLTVRDAAGPLSFHEFRVRSR